MTRHPWRIWTILLLAFCPLALPTAQAAALGGETRDGVPCEPSNLDDVVNDRTVRVPADPSQPDINPLPTRVLSAGSVALAPELEGEPRFQTGYEPYVVCRPDEGEENVTAPRTTPIPNERSPNEQVPGKP